MPGLQGRDIIGIAPTGSGKTAAFSLHILQRLWDKPQDMFAYVLSPTKELAYQTSAQFEGNLSVYELSLSLAGMTAVYNNLYNRQRSRASSSLRVEGCRIIEGDQGV